MNRQECFESGGHEIQQGYIAFRPGSGIIDYHCTKCEALVLSRPLDDVPEEMQLVQELLATFDEWHPDEGWKQ